MTDKPLTLREIGLVIIIFIIVYLNIWVWYAALAK